jgi:hypothetical protein
MYSSAKRSRRGHDRNTFLWFPVQLSEKIIFAGPHSLGLADKLNIWLKSV